MNDHSNSTDALIQSMLHGLRIALDMRVGFVSEFSNGRRVFKYVDADQDFSPFFAGDSDPLNESYCSHIVSGSMPEFMADARQNPLALQIPATLRLPVVAHMSAPIRFSDGEVYGTVCCFSDQVNDALMERDLSLLRLFSDFVAKMIEPRVLSDRDDQMVAKRIENIILHDRFDVHYQPIFDIHRKKVDGYEALTRFTEVPLRSPDQWFNDAIQVGLSVNLEMAVIRKIIANIDLIDPNCYVSINLSPETILKGALQDCLSNAPLGRIVVEVTEHAQITDYELISDVMSPLRRSGLRVAVDDAGSGYASFRHILKLKPDLIKMDSTLIHQIDTDTGSRALAAAIVRFAQETGGSVVAEGVETDSELAILRSLNVEKAQGYLLGRPMPLKGSVPSLFLRPVKILF